VRNWTHRDSVGRFSVTVSLVHGINAEEAAQSLLKLAQDHPKVMRHPSPTVHLSLITPAAMVFDLRGHTRDVFESINIASDLRIALTKLFDKSQLQPQLPTPPPYPATKNE
jgi:potassium-dependent mechanosensitive channel